MDSVVRWRNLGARAFGRVLFSLLLSLGALLSVRSVVAQRLTAPPPPTWPSPFLSVEPRYATSADFLIQQSADTAAAVPNSVYNGDTVTYTLRIENLSATEPITDVEITDLLPIEALEQGSIICSPACQRIDESETVLEPSGGTVVISTTRELLWHLPRLDAAEAYTVSFAGRVVGQPEGSVFTNRVFARYVSGGIEQAASAEDLDLTTLVRVPSTGGAGISTVPTWFSKDAGGTIAQDWGDFDLDGDLDLALGSSLGTSIYRNDAGTLTLIWQSPPCEQGRTRLSYGVRWADVIPDALNRPELIVVGNSECQTATGRGLNYIYAYEPAQQDFIQAKHFVSHLQLVRLVTGDFDGDGDIDLVGSTNAINGAMDTPFQTLCPVNLYRNDGLGQFTGTVTLSETHAVRCLSEQATAALGAADYDADGDLDLALGQFPSSLKILENQRDGQVLTDTDVLVDTPDLLLEVDLEYLPYDLAWADYDNDGRPELAAAYPIQRQARIYDQASGSFSAPTIIRTATFMTPLAVDWGDFNGDGRVDLTLADRSPHFYEYVPGTGFRRLIGLSVETSGGGQIWSLRGIELGSRQNLDLSVGNRDGPSRLYTVSTPKLATVLTEVADKRASSVAWGDADGNDDQDLLVGSAPLPELSAYLYLNRDGTFPELNRRQFTPSGFGPHVVAFGDVDLDTGGFVEIAIGTPTAIQIYQEAVFDKISQRIPVTSAVRSLAWGDANDDGRLDLLVGLTDGPVQLHLNTGTRLEEKPVFSTTQRGDARALAWGDFNGDYYLDYVVGFEGQPIHAYRNNGDQTFSLAWTSPVTQLLPVRALALGDYDADGDPDLAVGNGPGAADMLWENIGGNFGAAPIWATGSAAATTTAVAWGDWEADGTLDLVMGRDGEADVLYANLGSQPGLPQFAALWSSAALSTTTDLAWGDPDGDGDLDLGVSHREGPVGYYENTLITRDAFQLTDNPPFVDVGRPGTTRDGYFYSSPEILSGPEDPTVSIPYLVRDPEGDPLSQVRFEYSLSGGTAWQPATPASASPPPITQTTPTGTSGLFIWDAAADDAVSDNARFRVSVTSQKDSGPLQDISSRGISPPFRVRGLDCYWPAGASIITDPVTPTLGQEITFEGRVAFANGPVTYHWDFGDGETGEGWQVEHAYTVGGHYTVTLTVLGEACPIARPAFTRQQIEVTGGLIYLPLVTNNYTSTASTTAAPSPLSAPYTTSVLSAGWPSPVLPDNVLAPARAPSTVAALDLVPQIEPQAQPRDLLLLTNYALGINNQPAMSGDGNRIAFWSTGRLTGQNLDGNIEIFLAEIGEGDEIDYTQITSSTGTILGGFNLYPALDHDGDRIVFFSDGDLTGGNIDRNFEIFLAEIQADGSPTLTQITHTEDGVNILPDISGDGRFVTFVSDNDLLGDGQLMSNQLEIFRADLSDSQQITFTQITEGGGDTAFSDEPAISGDGSLIAFVSDQDLEGNGKNADGNQEIFLARVASDGTITYRQVTETTARTNEQPDLTDDGTRLIYLSNDSVPGSPRRIYQADIDVTTLDFVTAPQRLATAPSGDLDRPNLSGDGTRVAYYAVDAQDVYIYDLVDGDTKERTNRMGTYPSLSDGGTQMAFASDGRIYVKSYPLADLSLRKTSVVTQVAAGDQLMYTLTFTNSGPSAATDLVLIDELPDGVTSLLPQSEAYTTSYPPAVITDTNRTLFELPNYGGYLDAWTSMDLNRSLLHFKSFAYFVHPDDGRPYLRTFDTSSGSENNFECPLFACPSQTAEGKMGRAVYFDASNYIYSEDPIDLKNRSFSISFWAKREVANRGDWIAGQGTTGINQGLHIGFRADNRFTFAFFGDDLNTRPYEDTEWHHWACTYDVTTQERTIYRDGVAVAQEVAYTHYGGSGNFFLGAVPWAPEYFRGTLDEFAIYHRILSPEAIYFQYERQAPDEAAVFDSQVFTEPLGLDLWGALQWFPGQTSGEPLPDNQGADAYPPSVTGAVTMTDNLMLLHLDEPEGSTSFLDASGSGNDASCDGNMCPQAIFGRFNGALRFDGVDDTVSLPDYFPDAEDFTFAAWIYWNGGDLGQHIFDLGRDQGNRFYLSPQGTNGNLRFTARRDGVEEVVEGPPLPIGAWVHLAVTVEGDEGTIWLNGEQLSTGPITYDPQDVLGELTWLGWKPGGAPYFHGRMDEVAVFARALGADEIRDHYLRGATQVALQVRTCDDPACNAEPFVGLDGSRVSALTAADDAGSDLPTFTLSDLPANPYFQYRVLMSSYTTLTTPSLISVTVRPQVTCEGNGTETVTCQAGTEAAPLPPDRTLSLQLPAEVGTGAYFGAGETAAGVPVITNTARLENRESDHEPADNAASVTTTLESIPVQQVTISGPQYTATDVDTVLTATVSPANASPPFTFTWQSDLGTVGPYVRNRGTVTETFNWALPGLRVVTVTVDNGLGTVASDTFDITAVVPITNADLTVQPRTELGDATALTATIDTGTLVTYDWDFGDTTTATDGPTSSTQSVQSHVYPSVGVYTVTMQVHNPVSAFTETAQLTVADVPVENLDLINDGPTDLGAATTLTASLDAGTGVTLLWEFGDGIMTTTGPLDGPAVVEISHTYPQTGTYTAQVTATNFDNPPQTATTPVTVNDEPLSGLTLTSDAPGRHQRPVVLTTTLATGTNVRYTWDFGDGTPLTTTTYPQLTVPPSVQRTHVYTTYAPQTVYTASVTATNSAGVLTATLPVPIVRTCWAGIEGQGGDYHVLQNAIDDAPDDALIKIAGTCDTVSQRAGRSQVGYLSKTLTLRGGYPYTLDVANPSAHPTTLDAQKAGRVLYVGSGIIVTVQDLRLTGGERLGSGSEGGGVYVNGSVLTLTHVTITDSTTSFIGGGLFAQNSTVSILDSTLSHNSAGARGGGAALWTNNIVRIDATTFQENAVTAAGGDEGGGGLYLGRSGHLTLTHSVFVSNTSNWDGGGLYAYDVDADGDLNLTWDDNVFRGNKSNWGAAALIRRINRFDARRTQILDNAGVATGGTPDYAHSIFWLRDLTGPATLTNTLIANNTITETAGYAPGLEVEGTTATLLHATVANNTGGDGVGIRVDNGSAVELINSIIASQTVGIENHAVVDVDGMLWSDNSIDLRNFGSYYSSNEVAGDPNFNDPASGDYHVGPTSAAINQGVDAGVTIDIDGDLRDAQPDLGVDEYRTCRVQLNGVPYQTVQDAVDASASVADVVEIAGACEEVVYLNKTLTLRGGYRPDFTVWDPAQYPTTLDARGAGRVVVIDGTSGPVITPTVEGLRITGGSATGSNSVGGGIYAVDARPTLRDNIVIENSADVSGGGIYLDNGGGLLVRNTVISNTADSRGGGVYVRDASDLIAVSNVIAHNATILGGDGLYLNNTSARLYHTTVVDNGDIGVHVEGGAAALTNTIVASQTTGVYAGSGVVVNVDEVLWFGNVDNIGGTGSINVNGALTGDPVFVDPAGGDYHIDLTSPAVDAGTPITPAWADIDRQQHSVRAPDLGADETSALHITKRGPSPADIAAPITYTLTVTNTGVPAGGLLITDTLPADAAFVIASDGGTLVNGTTVSWTQAAPLATDAVLTRTFIVTATETITNADYRVTAGSGAVAVGTDVVTTTILPPALQITKSGPDTALVATPFTYTLTVTNTGSKLTQLTITDTLPTGAHVVVASDGGASNGNGVVVWDQLPNLRYGESLAVTLTVTATRTVTNDDYVVSGSDRGQTVSEPGSTSVTTVVTPNLSIAKAAPLTATAGSEITYTLTATNAGGLATGVVITDRLPVGANHVSGGAFSDPIVTCAVGDLLYQQTAQCTFTITAMQTITNADYGASSANGAATLGTDVVVTTIAPDLRIEKTAPTTATAGAEITYTLTLTNAGGLATGVVITDALPTGANFMRASGGISPNADDLLIWSLSNPLSYTSTIVRTFTVTATQTITNFQYGAAARVYRTGVPLPVVVKIE